VNSASAAAKRRIPSRRLLHAPEELLLGDDSESQHQAKKPLHHHITHAKHANRKALNNLDTASMQAAAAANMKLLAKLKKHKGPSASKHPKATKAQKKARSAERR